MDKSKIDLNAPAFGEGSQKVEELEPKDNPTEESQPKEDKVKEEEPEPSVEEQKVPYSRFKKFWDKAKELEAEVEELRSKPESKPAPDYTPTEEMTPEWKEMFGDSEASKRAYTLDLKRQEAYLEKAQELAEQKALEAVEQRESFESKRIENNLAKIDENMELLSDYVGRELTEKEQSEILDIVDEYSPKDDRDNYLATISFEKAWDILQKSNASATAQKKESRNAVAGLAGTQTQGEPDNKAEQDKNFNPLDWGAALRRLK